MCLADQRNISPGINCCSFLHLWIHDTTLLSYSSNGVDLLVGHHSTHSFELFILLSSKTTWQNRSQQSPTSASTWSTIWEDPTRIKTSVKVFATSDIFMTWENSIYLATLIYFVSFPAVPFFYCIIPCSLTLVSIVSFPAVSIFSHDCNATNSPWNGGSLLFYFTCFFMICPSSLCFSNSIINVFSHFLHIEPPGGRPNFSTHIASWATLIVITIAEVHTFSVSNFFLLEFDRTFPFFPAFAIFHYVTESAGISSLHEDTHIHINNLLHTNLYN